jgi:hypothetical protein
MTTAIQFALYAMITSLFLGNLSIAVCQASTKAAYCCAASLAARQRVHYNLCLNQNQEKTRIEANEQGKFRNLLAYFTTTKDGLVGYHRRGLGLPEPPKGKEYQRLGTMENNIFTIIGNRMKGRRACWSIEGGNNLARLLTLKHTGRLRKILGGVTPTRKLAMVCEPFGIRTAWHGPGDVSPIGHVANLHLDLSTTNFGIQEWYGFETRPEIQDVFTGLPWIKDGHAYVNDKPGWGIDMDDEKAKKHLCGKEQPKWLLARLPDGTSSKA